MSHTIKVLILEDSQNDAELIQKELKRSGFNFSSETVQTRDAFEKALSRFNPDIILSDYSLPTFDGATAFNIKQNKNPEIPFIIVSNTIGEENAVELIKKGVTDYILKDKLLGLPPKIIRALKDAEDKKAKKIAEEKIKAQNDRLFEIAFLQSHQIRVPVANILGLFQLFKFDNLSDPLNAEILCKLKTCAVSLDNVIREVVRKTSEMEKIRK